MAMSMSCLETVMIMSCLEIAINMSGLEIAMIMSGLEITMLMSHLEIAMIMLCMFRDINDYVTFRDSNDYVMWTLGEPVQMVIIMWTRRARAKSNEKSNILSQPCYFFLIPLLIALSCMNIKLFS